MASRLYAGGFLLHRARRKVPPVGRLPSCSIMQRRSDAAMQRRSDAATQRRSVRACQRSRLRLLAGLRGEIVIKAGSAPRRRFCVASPLLQALKPGVARYGRAAAASRLSQGQGCLRRSEVRWAEDCFGLGASERSPPDRSRTQVMGVYRRGLGPCPA